MQNMEIFLEEAVKYFPSEVSKLGISEVNKDNIYQKVMSEVGGEDKFLDFLMGFLNLLYEDFDMYFFRGFTEPSLLYHISVREEDLKKLIQDLYADKIDIGPKDYHLLKLKSYDKESVLQIFKLFVNLGKLALDVYKHYGKDGVLDKREREISERYPNIRELREKRVVTQESSETLQGKRYKQYSLAKLKRIVLAVALIIILLYIIIKLLGGLNIKDVLQKIKNSLDVILEYSKFF